jgi:two-component system, response regulator
MVEQSIEILYVEDNPDDEELTLLSLREHIARHFIEVVRDGEQALDYLFGTGKYTGRDLGDRPKLILLDLKLPKVNGLQVLEAVKRDERTRTLPVVILTSSQEDPDIQDCYRLGANSYIVKPVDYHQFKESVKHLGYYWVRLNEPPQD